jgi:hypothetical protein
MKLVCEISGILKTGTPRIHEFPPKQVYSFAKYYSSAIYFEM